MKRRIKFGSFFALLLFLLFSCQTEDIYTRTNSANSAKITNSTFEEIFTNPEHKDVIDELSMFELVFNRQNATAKLVYDDQFKFYIDKDNGKLIKNGDYHSYTFRVETEKTGRNIENVVFSYYGDGNYNVALVEYDIENIEYDKLTDAELIKRGAQISMYNKPAGEFSGFGCMALEVIQAVLEVVEVVLAAVEVQVFLL